MTDSPRCSVATAWLHDIDEDPGSKSTVRANPRGEPRDQCTRAITSCASQSRGGVATTRRPRDAASPKACAARDHVASANRYNTHCASKPHDVAAARTLATPRPTDPYAEASRQAWVGTTMPPGVATEGRAPSDDIAARNEHALNKRSRRRCPSNVVVSARQPKPPRTSHAAVRTGARSPPRRISRPKPKETARQLSDGVPEMTPKVLGLPSRNRRDGCTSAPARVPDRLRCVTRSGRNRSELDGSCVRTGARLPKPRHPPGPKPGKDPQQLRPDGARLPKVRHPTGRNRKMSATTAPRRGARVPKEHHPVRPKPKQGAPQLRPDDRPNTEAASPSAAETEKRSTTAALGRVPEGRRHATLSSRNRRESRVNNARTGARLPKVRRSWWSKPQETPQHPCPNECPFADVTSPPAAETEESSATSTPGRVPACRRNITPSSRNRREL